MKQIQTPVLFLVFNRPEKTEQTFAAIRKAAPTKLYVAIDAPRENRPDDVENCNKVKKIVKNVDWPCETHYLIQEKNLGCTLSGKTAWDWFFQQEDRMIFIEDDGLASISAFRFVDEALEFYKDNKRISYISPINYGFTYGEYSCFFSRYSGGTYFMGTWKRVYDLYDYDLLSYKDVADKKQFVDTFLDRKEYLLADMAYKSYIKSIIKGRRQNTYDLQISYLIHRYDMFALCSNIGMVRNIGFDGGANTSKKEGTYIDPYSKFEMKEVSTFSFPSDIEYSKSVDKKYKPIRNMGGSSSFMTKYLRCVLNYWILDSLNDFLRVHSSFYKKIKHRL